MNGYIQGKQICIFHFCLPCQLGSTLKGKNLLLEEQILPFRVDPFLKDLSFRESNRKSQKVVYFRKKTVEKNGGVPIKVYCLSPWAYYVVMGFDMEVQPLVTHNAA